MARCVIFHHEILLIELKRLLTKLYLLMKHLPPLEYKNYWTTENPWWRNYQVKIYCAVLNKAASSIYNEFLDLTKTDIHRHVAFNEPRLSASYWIDDVESCRERHSSDNSGQVVACGNERVIYWNTKSRLSGIAWHMFQNDVA